MFLCAFLSFSILVISRERIIYNNKLHFFWFCTQFLSVQFNWAQQLHEECKSILFACERTGGGAERQSFRVKSEAVLRVAEAGPLWKLVIFHTNAYYAFSIFFFFLKFSVFKSVEPSLPFGGEEGGSQWWWTLQTGPHAGEIQTQTCLRKGRQQVWPWKWLEHFLGQINCTCLLARIDYFSFFSSTPWFSC